MDDSFIIAIDFGTAYSGYSFSVTARQAEINPKVKLWGEQVSLRTPKAPTCILFNENEEFLKFGYEAQVAYFNLSAEEARKQLFFNCFKMDLYKTKITNSLTIKAANGRSLTALKVFTEALKYLKEDALKTINSNTKGKTFIASDFTWVLTVPAIWDHSAKQFMREAATQAGIVPNGKENKLIIALEPEAASVWCGKFPSDGFIGEDNGKVKIEQAPGTQYIVVDCGAGTIDITVHEVLDRGRLKELHKASGNDLGGQTVDRNFKEFLREIFGDYLWNEYEKKHPGDLQNLMHKVSVSKTNDNDVLISCPYNLGEMAREKQNIKKFFESVQGASWDEGSIKISKQKMRSFFTQSLNGIADSLKNILKKDFNIEYILLVGGYAESQILRQHIISLFDSKCKVLCPCNPQEVIMKGALLFGRNPGVVASRKSGYTYGVGVNNRFDASKHRADKKFTNKEGDWCQDVFFVLVKEDENVLWDEIRPYTFTPIERDQMEISFSFYCTEREVRDTFYVDEWGVEKIGLAVLKSPDTRRGMNRELKLEIKFGFTEMTAQARDIDSGSTVETKLDFITKS